MMRFVPRRSRLRLWTITVLVLLVLGGGGGAYLAWRQSVPGVAVTGVPPRLLGQKTAFHLTLEAARGNVTEAEVRVMQGGKPVVIDRPNALPAPRIELPVTVEPGTVGLREGTAELEVWARDDFWRPFGPRERPAATYPVSIDLIPPRLEVLAITPYVAPGGAGLIALRGDAARVDMRVGDHAFPTFALGPDGTRVGLFALPWNAASGTPLQVTAQDEAGNQTRRGVRTEVLPRRFRHDTIELTDEILQTKVPELLSQHASGQSLIEGFLVINRDQRRQAEETKRRLAAQTADRLLWEGPFLQPKNTKVFSNFAETRTYRYQGRDVDTQVHFGYDLASTRRAPVPAANSGVVVFAEPLTIYGNTIILDHGLGLMTLYGHLSTVSVKAGDTVAKGQEIGRTGTTGLAIGDHLHYEVLVNGVSVTPLEWWDVKWLRDRITGPLVMAGLPAIPGLGR
jgi:murein DD-endopeptidase MepM/ murein hydrolase activator NlpD